MSSQQPLPNLNGFADRPDTSAKRRLKLYWLAPALALLAACGGGSGGSESTPAQAATAEPVQGTARILSAKAGASANLNVAPISDFAARRFLTQASFGPTAEDVALLQQIGYAAWFERQWALPATSHRQYWEAADAAIRANDPTRSGGQDQVWESFWKQAVTGEDQLRLRVAYALSQIFVISGLDGTVGNNPRAMAAWLDMLGDKGLGTYRDLLEAVSLHPMMGFYLSSIRNQKADAGTGRQPDTNYAREVQQLFSIGIVKLNLNGTPVLVDGNTVDAYGSDDVAGLARVFTGFSYACPGAPTSNNCFFNGTTGGASSTSDPDRFFKPMVGYPAFHSTEAKSFLGVTIPPQTTANPAASLQVALNTLANHPNVGPFLGRQLIQRLVMSNPSPSYVQSVAQVFNNNGAGVRGDMKAVVTAVLTHPEAMSQTRTGGKLREPVLRLSAYLRAFTHTSTTTRYMVGNTDNPGTSLGQTPLRAPSVFNFYRPGYVAPGTQMGAAGLVTPEMQILNETTAAGWVNYMRDNLSNGVGQSGNIIYGVNLPRRDLQRDWSQEIALASNPQALVTLVMNRLQFGQTSRGQTADIVNAISRITIPTPTATNQAAVETARRNRVYSTVLLVLAAPEFLVQQ